jgi:hypothetical protein
MSEAWMRRAIDALLPEGPIITPAPGGYLDELLNGVADNHQTTLDDLADLAYIRNPWKCPEALLPDLEREFGISPNTALTVAERRSALAIKRYRKKNLSTIGRLQKALDRSGFGAGGYGLVVTPNSPANIPNIPDDPAGAALCNNLLWTGWTPCNCTLAITSGILRQTVTTTDPYITLSGLSIPGSIYTKVYVRFRQTAGALGSHLGIRATDNTIYKNALYTPAGLGVWQTLAIDMSSPDIGAWLGATITNLRLDLPDNAPDTSCVMEISNIYVGTGAYLPWHAPADPSAIVDDAYQLTAHAIGEGMYAGNASAYAAKRGGYYLVNGDQYVLEPSYPQAGHICARAFDGSDSLSGQQCAGRYTSYSQYSNEYASPPSVYWSLIFFVGGAVARNTNGSVAAVSTIWIPAHRRQELHRLILRYKPLGIWAAMIVQYS